MGKYVSFCVFVFVMLYDYQEFNPTVRRGLYVIHKCVLISGLITFNLLSYSGVCVCVICVL